MCENCKYVEILKAKYYGERYLCHRYPNEICVDREYWCGEYIEKES